MRRYSLISIVLVLIGIAIWLSLTAPKEESDTNNSKVTQAPSKDAHYPSKLDREAPTKGDPRAPSAVAGQAQIIRPVDRVTWQEMESIPESQMSAILDRIEEGVDALQKSTIPGTVSTKHIGRKRPIHKKEDSIKRLTEAMNYPAGSFPRKGFETPIYYVFSHGGPNGGFQSGVAVRKADAEVLTWNLQAPESK